MHTPFKYPISPSISQQILRLDWSCFIRSLVRRYCIHVCVASTMLEYGAGEVADRTASVRSNRLRGVRKSGKVRGTFIFSRKEHP